MQKQGQFYIIAAVVISTIIAGLITITNYTLVRPEPAQFYDLTKQLESEVGKIIEYGIYSNQDISVYIDNFIKNDFLKYAHEKEPSVGVIYIYGNGSFLSVVNYGSDDAGVITELNRTTLSGSQAQTISQVKLHVGNQPIGKRIVEEKGIFGNIKAEVANTKFVQVNISGKIYDFPLKGEQYFFAILKSEKNGEVYYGVV